MQNKTTAQQILDNAFIITGAMGSGKTSLIQYAQLSEITTVSEPARQILQEQRTIKGTALPEKDPALFIQLMLSRSIHNYRLIQKFKKDITLFDRAIPDLIAYARLFGLNTTIYERAARHFRYNKTVFMLPSWAEIYQTDNERKMSFLEAQQFGKHLWKIYQSLGYEIIVLEKTSIAQRLAFIRNTINQRQASR